MKKIIFLLCFALLAGWSVQAQKLSKEEKKLAKEWKKRKKRTKPLDFKKLVDEKEALSQRVGEIEAEREEINQQLTAKDNQLNSLRARNTQLSRMEGKGQPVSTDESGVIYKVQIGAYREMDLTYQTNNENTDLRSEEIDGGIKRYTLGRFRSLSDAENFKAYAQKMGVLDAFIVGYRDGVRDDSLVN